MRVLNLSPGGSSLADYALIAAGVAAVALVDYVSGADIQVLSLYFVLVAYAGWRIGRIGATIVSLILAFVWVAMLYVDGARYGGYVWLANFLAQGIAFLFVSNLVAVVARGLSHEQTISQTDPLTGLNTRRAFIDRAGASLSLCKRNRRPVSLAYIDLDNFKMVNDSLGHSQGDAILRRCAQTISENLRESDIAGRVGGDEFVVFLPETNAQSAAVPLERIRSTLETSSEFRAVGVTASIGVVDDESGKRSIEELLKRADVQMYKVKRKSKNRVGIHNLRFGDITMTGMSVARPTAGKRKPFPPNH